MPLMLVAEKFYIILLYKSFLYFRIGFVALVFSQMINENILIIAMVHFHSHFGCTAVT